jgi:rhodanese-related sulfurtransferase
MGQIGRLVGGAALLVGVSVAAAALTNTLRPSGKIAWVEDWSRYIEARALREGIKLADLPATEKIVAGGQSVIFDARPEADFLAGHLPGAVSLPYTEVEDRFIDVQWRLTPAQPVLAYCSGAECDESFLLAQFLKQQGFTNILLFAEGFATWEKAGKPVEKGAAP